MRPVSRGPIDSREVGTVMMGAGASLHDKPNSHRTRTHYFLHSSKRQWNEYVSEQGAFGCQLQTGDLVLSFNDKSVWAEAEKEIQHGLRLVLECYRPPYKPCPMTSPPFLQTNERLLDVCWARSRFLTTVYDDEEALANTPDGGLRDLSRESSHKYLF